MDERRLTPLTPSERFYLDRLSEEDRAVYEHAPGDGDLSGDIRLLRTLIVRLAEDDGLVKKEAAIRQAIGILYRLVQVQNRLTGDEGELEGEIRSLAAAFLAEERGELEEE